eukprot:760031-Hanusia_phi.AAC.3
MLSTRLVFILDSDTSSASGHFGGELESTGWPICLISVRMKHGSRGRNPRALRSVCSDDRYDRVIPLCSNCLSGYTNQMPKWYQQIKRACPGASTSED